MPFDKFYCDTTSRDCSRENRKIMSSWSLPPQSGVSMVGTHLIYNPTFISKLSTDQKRRLPLTLQTLTIFLLSVFSDKSNNKKRFRTLKAAIFYLKITLMKDNYIGEFWYYSIMILKSNPFLSQAPAIDEIFSKYTSRIRPTCCRNCADISRRVTGITFTIFQNLSK